MSVYIDTSALAKWYVAESDSDAFDDFIRDNAGALISRLTVVEMRCLLARRQRNRQITPAIGQSAYRMFESHIRDGFLVVLAMTDLHFIRASEILHTLRAVPLRTLDALHLAVAGAREVATIATADGVMVEAARALKFDTRVFH